MYIDNIKHFCYFINPQNSYKAKYNFDSVLFQIYSYKFRIVNWFKEIKLSELYEKLQIWWMFVKTKNFLKKPLEKLNKEKNIKILCNQFYLH